MKFTKGIFWIGCILILLQCSGEKDPQPGSLSIIPYPVTLTPGEGKFVIDKDTRIVAIDSGAHQAASILAEILSSASSFSLTPTQEESTAHVIRLNIKPGYGPEEAYELEVTEESIVLTASTTAGLFYGIQTLRQMLPAAIEKKDKSTASWSVPAAHIQDNPKYSYRGMHLDVSRHFFPVSFVKNFIDRLALYKFNRLHLHLTDDQGWRIQIKKYPELTDKGAWRKFNDQDSVCIEKSKDNPDFALPAELIKDTPEGKVYGGFYTQEEIREMVQYAADRQITIVPEIDMPGHMKAALNSYPELSCVDGSGWGKLFSIPLCPCEETTYEFAENILSEIVDLFPGQYVHIGGDEVDKLTWGQAKACKDLIQKERLAGVDQLQGYFIRRLEKFLQSKGKKMIGWDEVLDGGVDSTTAIMYWRGWVTEAPIKAAQGHHEVIMSPTSHCYFDYAPDRTTLEKLYAFNPIPEKLSSSEASRISGVQANIWTEWIPTAARLDYLTMPRMLALAEVGWAKPTSYEAFNARVSDHYLRMDELGINYRLPDLPALQEHVVFIDQATLTLDKPKAVTEIRYTTDGSAATASSKNYEGPITIDTTTTFRIITLGAGGRAGNQYTLRYEKQTYLQSTQPTFVDVKCRYFEGETFRSVKDTVSAKFIREAVMREIALSDFHREDNFALRFKTYLQVPEDGIYTFHLSSDDGSILRIGDRTVINQDGFQGGNEVHGQVALQKGSHLLELSYFEAGGGNSVSLEYEGPGTARRKL
jgi:hexosaminidase